MSDYVALRDLGDLVENTKKRVATEFTNTDMSFTEEEVTRIYVK